MPPSLQREMIVQIANRLITQLKQNAKTLASEEKVATLAEVVWLVQSTVLCCFALKNVSTFSVNVIGRYCLPPW